MPRSTKGRHPDDYYGLTRTRCNAHHLRELVAASETHPEHSWPQFAITALEKLNKAAHKARDAGRSAIPAKIPKPLITQFIRAVNVGLPLHPPERERKQGTTHRLLKHLHDFQRDTLRFAYDLTVPFTNNQAERDPCMIKAQLKSPAAGAPRHGAHTWLRVRAYISTLRMNNIHILTALRTAITGNP
ncbi:IS66 family transposase [Amycolatopsis minnesotensis]|uniref:IS66 family transposase n=1 Tax=Amycolatopsis minnesotensis TaxID=337894 RepID=UPI0031D30036